jgi:hypothetical protein
MAEILFREHRDFSGRETSGGRQDGPVSAEGVQEDSAQRAHVERLSQPVATEPIGKIWLLRIWWAGGPPFRISHRQLPFRGVEELALAVVAKDGGGLLNRDPCSGRGDDGRPHHQWVAFEVHSRVALRVCPGGRPRY